MITVGVVALAGVAVLGVRVVRGGPVLHAPGATGVDRVVASAEPDTPYVVDGIDLCLDRPGDVRIARVMFEASSGAAKVVDWGLRPEVTKTGTDPNVPQTMGERPEFVKDLDLTQTCRRGQTAAEMAIEVTKADQTMARGADLVVDYETGWHNRQLVIDLSVTLCGTAREDDAAARTCREIEAEEER